MQCVAIGPADHRLATGDATGRIRLYTAFAEAVSHAGEAQQAAEPGAGLSRAAQELPCTTWHWHAHAVGALCFSPDSTYLLSGGQEAVLVGDLSSHLRAVMVSQQLLAAQAQCAAHIRACQLLVVCMSMSACDPAGRYSRV